MSLQKGDIMDNIDKEIEILNEMIWEAIRYGGDAGGAYCSYVEDVAYQMRAYLEIRGWQNEYYVDAKEGEFPSFEKIATEPRQTAD
jgi:hypothetical protein